MLDLVGSYKRGGARLLRGASCPHATETLRRATRRGACGRADPGASTPRRCFCNRLPALRPEVLGQGKIPRADTLHTCRSTTLGPFSAAPLANAALTSGARGSVCPEPVDLVCACALCSGDYPVRADSVCVGSRRSNAAAPIAPPDCQCPSLLVDSLRIPAVELPLKGKRCLSCTLSRIRPRRV